jgi:hypothetical protein
MATPYWISLIDAAAAKARKKDALSACTPWAAARLDFWRRGAARYYMPLHSKQLVLISADGFERAAATGERSARVSQPSPGSGVERPPASCHLPHVTTQAHAATPENLRRPLLRGSKIALGKWIGIWCLNKIEAKSRDFVNWRMWFSRPFMNICVVNFDI